MYDNMRWDEIIYGATSAGGVFTGTGDIAWFPPGMFPLRLRRISVIISTALTVTSSILSFDYQPTSGSATGRVTAYAGTMTITTALGAQGKIMTTPELNLDLTPGGRLIVNQTQASTAGAGAIVVSVEGRFEFPGNNTNMTILSA
ncbi:MAG: hypothetical protein C5B59_17255 [Bacteroidetes bacterium]|nr:MAG: hypothetical protein C5B59_17255 [Bacteroidota bacterium]